MSTGAIVLNDVEGYARILREKAALRRLVMIGERIGQEAVAQQPAREIVERALADLQAARSGDASDWKRFTLAALDQEYQHYADNIDSHRIQFGIPKLDQATGGFAFGEVVTLIARTGVGKSAVAQNIIARVLEGFDIGVIFLSLEMPRLQAFERQLQIAAGVKRDTVLFHYRNNKSGIPAEKFVREYGDRVLIVDSPRMSIDGIRRFVRGTVASKLIQPVRLLVIDYLGFLDAGGSKASLTERISILARETKQLAKELECVVFLVAQTSRSAGDGSEEVTMIDARDSGAIEDSADVMLGCWRPELRKGIREAEYQECRGQLWFSILKNRRGPRDKFWVPFEGKTLRILVGQQQEARCAFSLEGAR